MSGGCPDLVCVGVRVSVWVFRVPLAFVAFLVLACACARDVTLTPPQYVAQTAVNVLYLLFKALIKRLNVLV